MRDMNGISHLRKIVEMTNIERHYWSVRENPTTTLVGLLVLPIPDRIVPSNPSLFFQQPIAGTGISFTGGRLRFQRR
jgi:hypothetical protein